MEKKLSLPDTAGPEVIDIDSATLSKLRLAYKAKMAPLYHLNAAEFASAYATKFSYIQGIAQNSNINIYNADDPATGDKYFAIVPADDLYFPKNSTDANCYLQDKTGLCPDLCDITKVDDPKAVTLTDAANYVNDYYNNHLPAGANNSIHVNKIDIMSLPISTAFVQFVWCFDPSRNVFSVALLGYSPDGKADYEHAISISSQDILRAPIDLISKK